MNIEDLRGLLQNMPRHYGVRISAGPELDVCKLDGPCEVLITAPCSCESVWNLEKAVNNAENEVLRMHYEIDGLNATIARLEQQNTIFAHKLAFFQGLHNQQPQQDLNVRSS